MAWLYPKPGSRFWWIGYRIDGRQFLKSTKEEDETKAQAVLARFEQIEAAKRANGLNEYFLKSLEVKTPSHVSLKTAVSDWLTECKRATGEGTAGRYAIVAGQFCEHLKADESSPLVRDLRTADITGFLNSQARTLAPSSVNLSRKVLSTFFNRCVANGLCTENPVKATKRAAINKKRSARRPYTVAELGNMLKKANEFWRYMIHGELYTGARMGDLICIRRDEINLETNHIRLRTGKTGEVVDVPIASPLRVTIMARLHALGPVKGNAYLWPEHAAKYVAQGSGPFSNEFYVDILAPCGIVPPRPKKHKKQKQGRGARRQLNDTTFHSLRHTFVSLLANAGVDKELRKRLVAHSSDEIHDIYTHYPPERLKAAIALLPEVI